MLAKNIVRINGYKGFKRTHVDVEVRMKQVEYESGGKHFCFEAPCIHFMDVADLGFANGLDAVTSYNYWNFCAQKRFTERIW